MTMNKKLIDLIAEGYNFSISDIVSIIENNSETDDNYLFCIADKIRRSIYGNKVYIRGLIEFSNYCKNDCLYCGLRCSNLNPKRYRITEDEILECCRNGYELGFRTFVLQSGEDLFFTDNMICSILKKIKENFSGCAVTLSIGEKSEESYQKYYDAGADRYLLSHETACKNHYSMLHPDNMNFQSRIDCLKSLKKIGFQTGAGFMAGSPFQTPECLAKDLIFLKELNPEMVGIGPFIPQSDTPFGKYPQGSLRLTLVMIALTRLILPHALIPSTTALSTIHPIGRELGLKAGANVVMPNLSPLKYRKYYTLYDNKLSDGEESAQCLKQLEEKNKNTGNENVKLRGDYIP